MSWPANLVVALLSGPVDYHQADVICRGRYVIRPDSLAFVLLQSPALLICTTSQTGGSAKDRWNLLEPSSRSGYPVQGRLKLSVMAPHLETVWDAGIQTAVRHY
jgi:hypothetical protein